MASMSILPNGVVLKRGALNEGIPGQAIPPPSSALSKPAPEEPASQRPSF